MIVTDENNCSVDTAFTIAAFTSECIPNVFTPNNDGYKDIFVANGIYKDLLDQDYVNFLANPSIVSNIIKSEKEPIKKLIDMIPTEPLSNFAFKNTAPSFLKLFISV